MPRSALRQAVCRVQLHAMRLGGKLAHHHPVRRLLAATVIAIAAVWLTVGLHRIPKMKIALDALDNTFYDAFYRFRKHEDRRDGPIVVVVVDEGSIDSLRVNNQLRWPWPRQIWVNYIKYLESCGARAIVFDMIFKEIGDFDKEFGKELEVTKSVIMANEVMEDGKFDSFAPPVDMSRVRFGAVNVMVDLPVRHYIPTLIGKPSLALKTLEVLGKPVPNWAKHQFLLHYYGPYKRSDGNFTFQTVSASRLAFASAPEGDADPQLVAQNKISASIFKDKIVLVGVSAQATYDDKSTPIAEHVPGVYVHATAIENLLNGQYVHPIEPRPAFWISLTACLLASIGIILPRMVMWKIMSAVATVIVLLAAAIAWFVGSTIYWLPMASPLLALVIAIIGAFARSYFLEDRQRRLLLKALAQYISPAVAAQIQRNPNIKLGGERRDMTVMFSDIQGFTDLSETMDSQKLSELLNFYLGEMAALVLSNNGTLDKYIGDAIMSFWNAPLLQPEHAELACRAALAMRDREAQIQDKLAERGAAGMLTRIGINTGPMVFGNMGSRQKFNYSVLGDSVNLGSRLEGANKFYGSRILIADTTARLVIGKFVLRQLDLLKVKGREKPVGVYELMAEGESNADMREKIERYGEAFAAYQAQRWDQADAILEQLHARFPNDLPTAALRKRIEKLRHDPPPKDWDGVYTAKDK